MKREAAELLKDALALPPDAGVALVAALLDSLNQHVDEDAETAWVAEINSRVAGLESGALRTIPWPEVAAGAASRPEAAP